MWPRVADPTACRVFCNTALCRSPLCPPPRLRCLDDWTAGWVASSRAPQSSEGTPAAECENRFPQKGGRRRTQLFSSCLKRPHARHPVWILNVIIMEAASVAWRVTVVISVTLCCLGASRLSLPCPVDATSLRIDNKVVQAAQVGSPQPCTSPSLQLKGSETSFEFRCPKGATLVPAEKSSKDTVSGPLEKVSEFTPTASRLDNPACTGETTLKSLVPGSTLVKVTGPAVEGALQEHEAAEPFFKLTVGEAVEQEKHFCYVCTTEKQMETTGVEAQSTCTVYVTVPKRADPPQDEHAGSGAFSPSMSGWLSLSVTGYVLGLMLHL